MSNYDSIFNAALEAYKRQTKNDLTSHPLLSRLQSCHSPHAILAALREQILIPSESLAQSQSGDGDDRFSRWLVPTVNVLYAFSATLAAEGAGVVNIEVCFFGFWRSNHSDVGCCFFVFRSQAFSPAKVIFAGIGVLLSVGIYSFSSPFAPIMIIA